MHKKPLLMIGNYLPPIRWNKNVWHYFAENLKKSGWEVIITSSKETKLFRLLDMLTTIWHKRNIYKLAQIDVFSGKAFIYVSLCAQFLQLLKKPFILTLHGGRLPEFAERVPRQMRRVLNAANVVVSPSPFHQKELKKYRSDIRFIPNPINLAESKYKQRGIPEPKLIWVRAFHETYNPSLAVKVIYQLMSSFPTIQLLMVGPDKGDGSLRRMLTLANELGVRDRINFTMGVPQTEIPSILNKGDIFINTTYYDTSPRSMIEAMANGLCIVTTNVGGIPWIIEQGKTGFLVPPNDPIAMSDAIRRILKEPGLASKLSLNARRKAEEYGWSSIFPRWEALIEEVLMDHYGKS